MPRPKKPPEEKLVMRSMYLLPEHIEQLRRLSEVTEVPVNTYIRQAVEDLLRKHAKDLKKRRPTK